MDQYKDITDNGETNSEKGVVYKLVLKNDLNKLVQEIEKVPSLITRRIMVNERDQYGRTPLFFAV